MLPVIAAPPPPGRGGRARYHEKKRVHLNTPLSGEDETDGALWVSSPNEGGAIVRALYLK